MNRDELLTQMVMEVAPSDWHDAQLERRYRDDVFGWNEYQLRRAELINRPSWDDAPEWAQWLSQEENGNWCWHQRKPEIDPTGWTMFCPNHEKHIRAASGNCPNGHDWRETLEARPAFDESRADAIGQNGNDGNHYRELNPTSSSLTHSQALEAARDTGICSDGSPCGSPHNVGDDDYCIGCPNEPMTPEEEELPAQEKHDCDRCGGCYYSPPHEECPCPSNVSDGSTASYYVLPDGAAELQDLISYRNMNAQDGEMFRALYRKGLASHSDALRDAKKVLFYAKAEVERLEKYGK